MKTKEKPKLTFTKKELRELITSVYERGWDKSLECPHDSANWAFKMFHRDLVIKELKLD